MKALIRLFILSILLGAGSVVATAQFDPNSAITVGIPMPFTVNGKDFSAGTYYITRMVSTSPPSALVMRGDGGSIIFNTVPTKLGTEPRKTHLVFDILDDGFMLSRIAIGGTNVAFDLRKTSDQRRRSIAAVRQRVVTVSDTAF
jgi:hypothetical protein